MGELLDMICPSCGGELRDSSDDEAVCACCGRTYKKQSVDEYERRLGEILGRDRAEKSAMYRRELWAEINSNRPDRGKTYDFAIKLKEIIPDDFLACFCEAVCRGGQYLDGFLMKADPEKGAEYAQATLSFLFRSMEIGNISAAGLYLDRIILLDPGKYGSYSDEFEKSCEKLKNGVYELAIPRDVFLAYSGKDIEKVVELCTYLEDRGVSCFLALRNLRHGAGAAENYDRALNTAADNCKIVVFVSSLNSRSISCDAVTKELKYIRDRDRELAPAQYRRGSYSRIPAKYKMPRVEYLLDSYTGGPADTITEEFFDGYEWCRTKEAVAERVARYLAGISDDDGDDTAAPAYHAPVASVSAPPKDDFVINGDTLTEYNGRERDVTVPKGVTKIGDRAFKDNPVLEKVMIPEGVKFLGGECFSGCTRLSSVYIPESMICIDGKAFCNCMSLSEIYIPAGVADIGAGIFIGCYGLARVICGAPSKPGCWNTLWCQCKTRITWNGRRPL